MTDTTTPLDARLLSREAFAQARDLIDGENGLEIPGDGYWGPSNLVERENFDAIDAVLDHIAALEEMLTSAAESTYWISRVWLERQA